MDLEDWEYLPDAATCLLRDGGGVAAKRVRSSSPETVFNMDYFSTGHLPQSFSSPVPSPTLQPDQIVNHPLLDLRTPVSQHPQDPDPAAAVSHVFFQSNFSKETTEFVDMKILDSRSHPAAALIGEFKFGDDVITLHEDEIATCNLKSDDHQLVKNDVNWVGEGIIGDDYMIDDDDIIGGLNLWKLGFGGIGAICSFGVAAAAICLVIFGNNHKAKQSFHIYGDNKRMKQVVQHVTNFNEAMSAHITYGGFYDNAL